MGNSPSWCIQLGPCNRVAVAVASQEGRRTTPAAQAQTGASLVADAVDALEELGGWSILSGQTTGLINHGLLIRGVFLQ